METFHSTIRTVTAAALMNQALNPTPEFRQGVPVAGPSLGLLHRDQLAASQVMPVAIRSTLVASLPIAVR